LSSLDHLATALDIKQVSEQRIISGHAAAWSLDRVGDTIDPKAFTKTLSEKTPADVAVFIGHNSAALPVGIPLVIRPDEKGLYTEVRVFDGPAGDNLLAVARGLKAHGQTLGLSIGYRVRDSKMERTGQGMVRRLLDIDLIEFSYAASQSIANPAALMTGVKHLEKTGAPGTFEASRMALQSALRDAYPDRWAEIEDLYPDRVVYCLSGSGGLQRGYYQASYTVDASGDATLSDAVEVTPNWTVRPGGDEPPEPAAGEPGDKTTRSTRMDLPDSAYLWIEPGGARDEEGKTVPRSYRHFSIRDAEGKLDAPGLRFALAAIPQVEGLDAESKTLLSAQVHRALEATLEGKAVLDLDTAEWKTGAAISVRAIAYGLLDASDTIAAELKAMALLGSDTKNNGRLRPELRQKLDGLAGELGRLVRHAELIDAEQDGAAQVALNRSRLQLLEV
jgi:HK97 family phage prohead protease